MNEEVVYRGFRRAGKQHLAVLEGNRQSDLEAGGQRPNSFAWGVRGRATDALALGILLHALGDSRVYAGWRSPDPYGWPPIVQAFAHEVLERLPRDGFALKQTFVLEWADNRMERPDLSGRHGGPMRPP